MVLFAMRWRQSADCLQLPYFHRLPLGYSQEDNSQTIQQVFHPFIKPKYSQHLRTKNFRTYCFDLISSILLTVLLVCQNHHRPADLDCFKDNSKSIVFTLFLSECYLKLEDLLEFILSFMENRSAMLDSLDTEINQQHLEESLNLECEDYLLAAMDNYFKLPCTLEIL
jgi:hypothetical protein